MLAAHLPDVLLSHVAATQMIKALAAFAAVQLLVVEALVAVAVIDTGPLARIVPWNPNTAESATPTWHSQEPHHTPHLLQQQQLAREPSLRR